MNKEYSSINESINEISHKSEGTMKIKKDNENDKILFNIHDSFQKKTKFSPNSESANFERAIKKSKKPDVKFPSFLKWVPDLKSNCSLEFFLRHFIGGCFVGFKIIIHKIIFNIKFLNYLN